MVSIELVYSTGHDDNDNSTEAIIQRMIEGAQRMIRVSNNNNGQEEKSEIKINPAMKRHFELEIERERETLQNAPEMKKSLPIFLGLLR